MQRAPLTPIDPDRRAGSQLSDNHKFLLYGRALVGQLTRSIAKAEGLNRSTVGTVLQRVRLRGTPATAPRTGRPKKHDARDDRRILRIARAMPKITYTGLKREAGLEFSWSTY